MPATLKPNTETPVPKLSPCPFCAGIAELVVNNLNDQNAWRVECFRPICGAVVLGDSAEDAAKRWNRRGITEYHYVDCPECRGNGAIQKTDTQGKEHDHICPKCGGGGEILPAEAMPNTVVTNGRATGEPIKED
jgi:ssDNA-binding Zn-finger/Zn-ribbon topoisomerase 1